VRKEQKRERTRPGLRTTEANSPLPRDEVAERAVIGSIIIDNSVVDDVLTLVKPADFWNPRHQVIFQAIVELHAQSSPIDGVTLPRALIKADRVDVAGGLEYVSDLTTHVADTSRARHYALTVKEDAIRRKAYAAGKRLSEKSIDMGTPVGELLTFTSQVGEELAEAQTTGKGLISIADATQATVDHIQRLRNNQAAITGVPTGLTELDRLTAGLQPTDQIILAGRPSMGKTAFALYLARYMAMVYNYPVAIFSVEMSLLQLHLRLLCSESGVNAQAVRTGQMTDEEAALLNDAVDRIYDAPIYIDEMPGTIEELKVKARAAHKKYQLKAIILDYIQLMDDSDIGGSREQEIARRSRELKRLAKELEVPCLTLAQLNRSLESRQDKRPVMSDLRESGSLEQDADLIMFMYRDEVYNKDIDPDQKGVCEIIIAKQRNGPTGTVKVMFEKETGRFSDLER